MVNKVVDLTLTKARSPRAFFKRLTRLWLGLAVIGMLLAIGVIPGLQAVGFIVVGLSYLLLVLGLFIKGL